MNALSLVVLLALAAVVASEQCSSTANCNHVSCDASHELGCVRGQCTCTDHTQTCSSASDCNGNCNRSWHCVDTKCRCGFGIGK